MFGEALVLGNVVEPELVLVGPGLDLLNNVQRFLVRLGVNTNVPADRRQLVQVLQRTTAEKKEKKKK